ncbi:MAG TPA: SHOCT domain-containing protein [Cellulomonas sp.]
MSLLRTAKHVAVASAVSGRIRERQVRRMAASGVFDAPQASAAARPPEAVPAPSPPAAVDPAERIALLRQLGELRDSGVLTPEEFEAQKSRLLA